jgi:hypothetical protein
MDNRQHRTAQCCQQHSEASQRPKPQAEWVGKGGAGYREGFRSARWGSCACAPYNGAAGCSLSFLTAPPLVGRRRWRLPTRRRVTPCSVGRWSSSSCCCSGGAVAAAARAAVAGEVLIRVVLALQRVQPQAQHGPGGHPRGSVDSESLSSRSTSPPSTDLHLPAALHPLGERERAGLDTGRPWQ